MATTNDGIKFFIDLAKTQTILNNRFDRGLGGLGFNEFLILYHLNEADDKTLRRVDLASKVGMTASGVTRLLLPMEKVHLIKSGPQAEDARVRSVILAAGGKTRLEEATTRLEELCEDIFSEEQLKKLNGFSDLLVEIGGKSLMV